MAKFDRHYKLQSVLNTDGFDRRTYTDLHNQSDKLQSLEEEGSKSLPTFPHLMADTWASLYKNQPRLLPSEEIKKELHPNRTIMEKVFQSPEFTSFREYTKLDELASALGTVQMGNQLQKFVDENIPQDLKEQLQHQQDQQQAAEKAREKAEALEELLKMLQESGANNPSEEVKNKIEKIKKQVTAAKKSATKAEKQANQTADEVSQAMDHAMQSSQAQKALAMAMAQSQQGLKEDTQALETILGGLDYGTQPGQPLPINPVEAIKLAEYIRNRPKFKKIADLSGRMKKIAAKKQKTKTKDTMERTDISLGNDPNRLLPQEVALMSKPETKMDFLRRFAEGKLLEYSPRAKDTLGRGPIVVCRDTSGSMLDYDRDEQANAVALALLSLAKKQKRAYALVNFASKDQVRTWEYPDPRKIMPNEIIEMAEFFWDGGTDFMAPLDAAVEVIRKSKFNKADIVFITDGSGKMLDDWLKKFNQFKKEKKFSVISIYVGSTQGQDMTGTIKMFSDKVVAATSLLDDAVTEAVFSI